MSQPITVEQEYNAAPACVWKAITNADEIRQWYFNLAGFKTEAGYEFQFNGGTEQHYLHLCRVTEAIPGQKLSHTWRYDGYDGVSEVTWELSPEGDKTHVRLTHAGLETFPAIADFARSNFETGWNEILGKDLKNI